MENKSYIWITLQKVGFHKWSNAPDAVGFLSAPHRHIFHFKIYIQLLHHNDREIEFFMFKKDIEQMLKYIWIGLNLDEYKHCAGVSCEMISDKLNKDIGLLYPNRNTIIEVSEDGENGSRKEYNNHNI